MQTQFLGLKSFLKKLLAFPTRYRNVITFQNRIIGIASDGNYIERFPIYSQIVKAYQGTVISISKQYYLITFHKAYSESSYSYYYILFEEI